MIRVTNIPDDIMDTIMEIARKEIMQPQDVIKMMLGLVDKNEAMNATYEYKRKSEKT